MTLPVARVCGRGLLAARRLPHGLSPAKPMKDW